jgi:hypothetical protein
MNSVTNILCPNTFAEAFAIGVITLVLGKTGIYFGLTEEEKDKKEQQNLALVFFLIGFVLHFLIEIIGLNKWYCNKCSIN